MVEGNEYNGNAKIDHKMVTLMSEEPRRYIHIAGVADLAHVERSRLDSPSAPAKRHEYRDHVRGAESNNRNTDKRIESRRRAKVDTSKDHLNTSAQEPSVDGQFVSCRDSTENLAKRNPSITSKSNLSNKYSRPHVLTPKYILKRIESTRYRKLYR